MTARKGRDYLQGLRDAREIWLEGERVSDVTTHPALRGGARSLAAWYDFQHAHADECLVSDPATGAETNVSHLIPRSRADLERRHVGLERMARFHVGTLGRTPDYVNVSFAGFAGLAALWAEDGNEEGAAHLVAFQRQVADRDLALTHVIVHPTVDKSQPDVAAGGGEIALHKVEDTAHGILVRGARVLATLAPFADELTVYPGQPLPPGAERYALAFSLPMATPGLRFLCRDSCSVAGSPDDRPFSSRFDEQDAFVIFDDVEVPRERLFLDGSAHVYNRVMTRGWVANIMQQTCIRATVKLRFAYELATRMARAIGADDAPTARDLGELWSYYELTRAALAAAEAGAGPTGDLWLCDDRPFRALRPTLPGWFVRVNQILRRIGAHNLLAAPGSGELADATLRPLLERYLPGAHGMGVEERARLFRTAWDFVGSALGARSELYEMFYLASAPRMYQVAHAAAQRSETWTLYDEFWEEHGG
ncbi:MAG: 4-hydroxyphenylacetate 3-hydroxylase N-terminal domain-containing protein [Myxococcota bacterium]